LIEAIFILVENLPDKFNQVRNIIFSAFPKSMQPPDPFRATEQIEMREEFRVLPNNLFDFQERVVNTKLHEEIVKYLTAKNDVNEVYFRNICSKFLTKDANVEIKINQPVVNAFVLFVPWMIYKSNDDYPKINEWKMASYGLFWKLLVSSNQQMRETLLNSIINQIRYPNPITFYFTNLIFYIFSVPSSDDNLLEQIIKIFIDRLIVDRPHPWGIMYAFIELIKEKEVFRKKNIFKGTEFEEMVKLVFKGMGKGDGTEN
jgi:CCR4-NOT transcription complex subunit 1